MVAQDDRFFDRDYAMHLWTNLKTRDVALEEWNRVVPIYEEWKEPFGRYPRESAEAMRSLEDHPQRDLIQKGHDFTVTHGIWSNIYQGWITGRSMRPEPWNENTQLLTCLSIRAQNIFTEQCNDLPDWRTDESRARDDRVMADYRARQER